MGGRNHQHYHYSALPTNPPTASTPQSTGTNSSSAWVGRKGSGGALNSSLYDNTGLGIVDPLLESVTSDSTATTKTGSTVRTVGWKLPMPAPPSSDFSRTHPESDMLDLDHHMTESVQVEELLTDEVMITHPRSLLILASLTAVLSTQIAVLGMIARFYEGCPWGTGIWVPILCLLTALLGFAFLKFHPRRWLLYVYTLSVFVCAPLVLLLFIVTAQLLSTEHVFELNRIVENTKIAMYSLHLILTPVLEICVVGSLILLILNIREAAEGKVRRGYYVSSAAQGHQTVLVPVSVKQVREMPVPESQKSVGIQTSPLYVDR